MSTKLNLTESQTDNLKSIYTQLGALGVTSVAIAFNGGGDEGHTDSAQYLPEGHQAVPVEINDMIDVLAHDILVGTNYDWYNNDGGCGDLTMDVKGMSISVDMNIFYTESENHLLAAPL